MLLGVDFAGLVPFLLIIIIALVNGDIEIWGHVLFIVSAFVALLGVFALFLLLRSEMANQYLDSSTNLRHNVEGKKKKDGGHLLSL